MARRRDHHADALMATRGQFGVRNCGDHQERTTSARLPVQTAFREARSAFRAFLGAKIRTSDSSMFREELLLNALDSFKEVLFTRFKTRLQQAVHECLVRNAF